MYHLSWNSFGGLALKLIVFFPLGFVLKLGISILYLLLMSMPGVVRGGSVLVSFHGGIVSEVHYKVSVWVSVEGPFASPVTGKV